jgi:hypothetical protein
MTEERNATVVTAAMAAAFFLILLLPSLSPHYGFYSDELYYLACTDRLALGYVDQPPFFPFVLRVHRELFGDSLFALRMLPAAAGALTAFLTGWMARRMGGGLFAQVLATLATMASPQLLVLFGFFSVNCLEVLLWTTTCWLLLELCRSREPRWWAALGVALGFSLLTKHTTALLITGLVGATLLSPLRRDALGPWPWAGALAAVLIVSPNVYWQIANDWPSIAFYRSVAETNIPTPPLDGLVRQIVVHNPASFPIWAAGLYFFVRQPRGRPFRPLGWLFLMVLAIAMIGGQSRPDRIAGVFPVAFAGGSIFLEAARKVDASRFRRIWNTYSLPSIMIAIGLGGATLTLPILPPDLLIHHPLYEGDDWRDEPGPKRLPYILGNRTHWEAFVAEVAEVYRGLDPEEREGAIILADYFGHAGAIERYGGEYGLPPVYSPHTNYFVWGPPAKSPDRVIAIGIDASLLRAHFGSVKVAAVFECTYCPWWQDQLPIRIASAPKRSFSELWLELGRIGGMDRHRRLVRAQESP